MRRMSFALTTAAVLNRTKTVTRRAGWLFLKPGHRLLAVDKVRRKNAQKLAVIEVVDVRREPLSEIDHEEFARCGSATAREGFPDLSPGEFIEMFCREMECTPETIVTRIQFRYVDPGTPDHHATKATVSMPSEPTTEGSFSSEQVRTESPTAEGEAAAIVGAAATSQEAEL